VVRADGRCSWLSLGLLSSIWAEKFDHNAAVTNFVIAPLSLLSGTFYVIDNLAPAFQAVSRLNPFFYVISGFRFGFLGQSDIGSTNTGGAPRRAGLAGRWCSTACCAAAAEELGLLIQPLLTCSPRLRASACCDLHGLEAESA
jgi:hypothetical protein